MRLTKLSLKTIPFIIGGIRENYDRIYSVLKKICTSCPIYQLGNGYFNTFKP